METSSGEAITPLIDERLSRRQIMTIIDRIIALVTIDGVPLDIPPINTPDAPYLCEQIERGFSRHGFAVTLDRAAGPTPGTTTIIVRALTDDAGRQN